MADEKITRKLAAILIIDMVGYSRRMSADEAGTLARLKSYRQDLIDPKFSEYGGRVVKLMGDGALVEFASVVDAVGCATEIQRDLSRQNADVPEDCRFEFRIGLNLGDIIIDGDDIYGDGINVAARLEELAQPGEVWLAGTVYDHVKAKVDIDFEALGERQLKNIAEPVQVFRIKSNDGGRRLPELHTLGDDLPLPEKPSIAILPFKNLSGDPEQDHLAEGFRLDIQAGLIRVSELFLIATGTVNSYRTRDVNAGQAGRQMGVRYVLEGGIRKLGQRIRLNVELTDSIAQQIIWADHYDRSLDDALAVPDEVVIELIEAIGIKLIGEEAKIFQSTLKSFEAKESFYQGLSLTWTMTKDGNAAARKMFESVAKLQPDSPVGPTYVSFSHWLDIRAEWTDSKEQSLEQAVRWAEKALEFEVTNGLAHVVVAYDNLINNRYDEALAESYKSVENRPNCPTANGFLANVLLYGGRAAEAMGFIKKALRLSPIYPVWFVNVLATVYRDCSDLRRSISAAKQSIELNPSNIEARMILCSAYQLAEKLELAKSMAREVAAIDPHISLAKYINNQPYKDREILDRLIVSLREAGLPE